VGVLVASAMLALAAGCDNNDDKKDMAGGDPRGNWQFSEGSISQGILELTITADIAEDLGLIADATIAGGSEAGGTISGHYYDNGGSDSFTGTWTASDNLISITYEGETQVFAYNVEGDTLTLIGDMEYEGSTWQVKLVLVRV
jgi:hypothetical protein